MKWLAMLLMAFVVSACQTVKYTFDTRVQPDGSCLFTASVHGDSTTSVKNIPFIIPQKWEVKDESTDTVSGSRTVWASSHLATVDFINQLKKNDSCAWSIVERRYEMKKKFRWFYTYYHFELMYSKLMPFDNTPITDYLANDEILLFAGMKTNYMAGRDSVDVEKMKEVILKKVFDWLQQSMFNEFVKTISDMAVVDSRLPFTANSIATKRDSLQTILIDTERDIDKWALMHTTEAVDSLQKVWGNFSDTSKLQIINGLADYTKKCERIFKAISASSDMEEGKLELPGKLIESNVEQTEGNVLEWNYDIMQYFIMNQEVKAISRVTNTWAFVVTAIVLLMAVVGVGVRSFALRKKTA